VHRGFLLAGAVGSFITGDLAADVLTKAPAPAGLPVHRRRVLSDGVRADRRRAGMAVPLGWCGATPASLSIAVTLTAGLGLLSYIFLIRPYVENPDLSWLDRSISIAYPLADIVVLAVGAGSCLGAAHACRRGCSPPAVAGTAQLRRRVRSGAAQRRLGDRLPTTPAGPRSICCGARLPCTLDARAHRTEVVRASEERLGRLILLGLSLFIAPTVCSSRCREASVRDAAVIAAVSALLSGACPAGLGRA